MVISVPPKIEPCVGLILVMVGLIVMEASSGICTYAFPSSSTFTLSGSSIKAGGKLESSKRH